MYWAFQTFTTVGYGDIPAVTLYEKTFATIWMIVGFTFYSYTIGNFQSILNEIDQDSYQLQLKQETFNEFAKRTALPTHLLLSIRRFIDNNSSNVEIIPQDVQKILEELPLSMKGQIARQAYAELIENVKIFQDKPDHFLWEFLPKL